MNYLILKNNSVVVFGENGSIIYNLSNKDYYSIDLIHTEILREIKRGTPISEIKMKFEEKVVLSFFEQLITSEIAEISEHHYVEEYSRIGHAKSSTNLDLTTCYIELPTSCTKECENCESLKLFSCLTCTKPKVISEEIDLEFYRNILNEILQTPVSTLIFHGGDPLIKENQILELLKYTREHASENLQIIVKTNGELIDDKYVKSFIKYKINPLIVFNSTNKYEKELDIKLTYLREFLNELSINNIDYFGNILFDDPTPQQHEISLEKLKNYNFKTISISIVIDEQSDLQKYSKINFSERLSSNFSLNKDLHPCLNGIIAVTSDRKISPCPTMTNHILLDLNRDNFIDLFDTVETLDTFWRFSLEKIETCQHCKFRFSCVDCRSLEDQLTNDYYKKDICYIGESIS
ncbi:radical SAM protein with 4Fe4S-binding SPASM domain [Paenibacillus sp. DS2015]|uniref:4Fe-4S cluster-binding domain-containing protein n=1 Tax=Paenibacillus sp. DS2015 TaxID=3373917 RepID=UPI003D225134